MHFQDMVEENKAYHSLLLGQAVGAVLTDPTYNIRRVQNDVHSANDPFSSEDVKDLHPFCKNLMKQGASGHIFRRAVQFMSSCKHFFKELENADVGDE